MLVSCCVFYGRKFLLKRGKHENNQVLRSRTSVGQKFVASWINRAYVYFTPCWPELMWEIRFMLELNRSEWTGQQDDLLWDDLSLRPRRSHLFPASPEGSASAARWRAPERPEGAPPRPRASLSHLEKQKRQTQIRFNPTSLSTTNIIDLRLFITCSYLDNLHLNLDNNEFSDVKMQQKDQNINKMKMI